MRPLAFALLACLAAPSLAAPAAPALHTVAILPPVAEGAEQPLAFAIQGRAATLLEETGRYTELHIKQVLRVLEADELPPTRLDETAVAVRAARMLGADGSSPETPRFVAGRLRADKQGYTLDFTVGDGKNATPSKHSAKLPPGLADAIAAGGLAVARAVAAQDGVTLAPSPASTDRDPAVRSFLACAAVLVRQPIGIEIPTVLAPEELAGAVKSCQAAVAADPAWPQAWSALGLALAIDHTNGNDDAAIAALRMVPADAKTYYPFYWIARFWLVTRYQSSDAGLAVLRDAIQRHPGFLLARGWLAETLNALHRHDEALKAWQEYLTVTPRAPYVVMKIGYTLARLGRTDEAIAKTKEALALAPGSRGLQLELASRYLDARKLDDGVKILEAEAAEPPERGEVMLRLGYALFLRGDLDRAEQLFRKALAIATSPSEWRTRARGHYDLARILLRRNKRAEAEREVREALHEGLQPTTSLREDADLIALVHTVEGRDPAKPHPKLDLTLHPTAPMTSPFALNEAGEIEPTRQRPQPPAGFDVLRQPGFREQ